MPTWNPAGLAQIDRREVQVGLLRNSRENTSTFNGTSAGSELSNTRFGSLGFVYPYPVYRGSLVFSVGFKRIKDFDWSLRQTGLDAVDSLYVDHRFQHEGELSLSSVAVAVDVERLEELRDLVERGVELGVRRGRDARHEHDDPLSQVVGVLIAAVVVDARQDAIDAGLEMLQLPDQAFVAVLVVAGGARHRCDIAREVGGHRFACVSCGAAVARVH